MRNRLGILCMFLGTVLVLAALSLFCYNHREAQQAKESVDSLLPQLTEIIRTDREDDGKRVYPDPFDAEMTVKEIDGYGYVGILSIPSLGLELPVMSAWDYDRLKLAPCRYAGSVKTDDLVLCAHNYEQHFGRLSELKIGDPVCFMDMDGQIRTYSVEGVETLQPAAIDEMCAGDVPLTLFTCTYSGQSRVTVRCVYS